MLKTCCRAAWAAWRSIIWSNLPITCTAVEVVKQGDHGSELFIIRSGEVTVLVSKVRHVCFPHLGWWEATPPKSHTFCGRWMTFSKDKWWDFLSFVYQPYLGKISNLTMFFYVFLDIWKTGALKQLVGKDGKAPKRVASLKAWVEQSWFYQCIEQGVATLQPKSWQSWTEMVDFCYVHVCNVSYLWCSCRFQIADSSELLQGIQSTAAFGDHCFFIEWRKTMENTKFCVVY